MNEKIVYASAKPSEELLGLFEYAQKLDADGLGKAEVLERAEGYFVKNKEKINFKEISHKKVETTFSGVLPSSFKVRINNIEIDAEVNEILKKTYNINRIMTPFKLRVVLSSYINYLLGSSCEGEVRDVKNSSLDTLRIRAISLLIKADENELKSIIREKSELNEQSMKLINAEYFLKNIEGDFWTNDPDDTMEARGFYSSYWRDIISRDIGLFRGDTILSFNTIAGCIIRLLSIYNENFEMPQSSRERLDIITESKEVSDSIKENFKRFYDIYHTFSNFMPVIKTEKYYKKGDSPYLQYVKNNDYHEFPDLFFAAIRLYYHDKDKSNDKFLADINPKYFDIFGAGDEGWRNFVEKNYLQDFFIDADGYRDLIQLAPESNMPYNKRIVECLSVKDKNECMQQISIFLTNAVMIIERRASRLAHFEAVIV